MSFHHCLSQIFLIASLPAGGSSNSDGSWRECVGDDGVSGGVVMEVVFPPPPPLGPDSALLRWGLAGTEVDVELPLVESLVVEVLEDEVGVEILAGLWNEMNK